MAGRSAFSAKDLALALPDKEVGDSLSLRYINEGEEGDDKAAFKPAVDKSKKVTRYRAGQVPKWADEDDETSWVQKLGQGKDEEKQAEMRRPERGNAASASSRVIHEAEIVEDGDEDDEEEQELARRRARARARRMAQEDEEEDDNEEAAAERVEGDVAVAGGAEDEDEEEDEDAIAARRAAIRAKLKKREAAQEEELAREEEDAGEGGGEGEEDEEGSSSEYETDTDEDEEGGGRQPLFRPVFVSKSQRDTIAEKERKEAEAAERAEAEAEKQEKRKIETRQMVADEIRRDEDGGADEQDAEMAQMPDDNDEVNEAEEYEAWKLRELMRIKADKEERVEIEKEKAETERRRNMTDEERAAEDAKLGKNVEKEKAKWKFMQKYHHKGAFYMDDDSIKTDNDVRRREPDGPTLEDNFDKTMLPKVMQVKKFGFAGRTKYTHLVDQDTTDRSSSWHQQSDHRQAKYQSKMGGVHGDLDAVGRKRKRKAGGGGSSSR